MNILIVKLHALGDFVIHTPAFERLRKALPDAHFELLTTDWAAPAVKGLKFFDARHIVPVQTFFNRTARSYLDLLEMAIKLRTVGHDACISFHLSKDINRYLFFSAGNRLFSYGSISSPSTVFLDENRHSAVVACELADLAIMSISGRALPQAGLDSISYKWAITAHEESEAIERLKRLDPDRRGIALYFPGGASNPSNKGHERRWPAHNYSRLAEMVSRKWGFLTVVTGSISDREVCAEMSSRVASGAVDISGQLDIRQVAALARHSRLVVANDSAPLHITAAVGAPTVGIFGPTGSNLKQPPGDHVRSVKLGLPCSPCYYTTFKGCKFDSIRCLVELDPEHVYPVVEELLLAQGSH
jgi:ADP-heptose:LPS heptosyltransferase